MAIPATITPDNTLLLWHRVFYRQESLLNEVAYTTWWVLSGDDPGLTLFALFCIELHALINTAASALQGLHAVSDTGQVFAKIQLHRYQFAISGIGDIPAVFNGLPIGNTICFTRRANGLERNGVGRFFLPCISSFWTSGSYLTSAGQVAAQAFADTLMLGYSAHGITAVPAVYAKKLAVTAACNSIVALGLVTYVYKRQYNIVRGRPHPSFPFIA